MGGNEQSRYISERDVRPRNVIGKWYGCGLRELIEGHAVPLADVDWAAVYAEQLPRVYNYLRFRVGDEVLAEELTAQTFERAWRARARYRDDLGGFSTWLFTIAGRVATAHFRRWHVRREVPLDVAMTQPDRCPVEEVVQRRGDLARLHVLLARLNAREREMIELKYGARLTNRAIAQLTGLSESNVGTTLHRTVRRLAAMWEEADGERSAT